MIHHAEPLATDEIFSLPVRLSDDLPNPPLESANSVFVSSLVSLDDGVSQFRDGSRQFFSLLRVRTIPYPLEGGGGDRIQNVRFHGLVDALRDPVDITVVGPSIPRVDFGLVVGRQPLVHMSYVPTEPLSRR